MAVDAFDLTEKFQTPIFVMTDLDLGMNNWMSDTFKYPTASSIAARFSRRKIWIGWVKFERYRDVDGDGIPYRTLPGTDHPAAAVFHSRKRTQRKGALYSEKPEDYKNNMDRLAKKYDTRKEFVPQPEIQYAKDAKIGFLAFGTTHWAIIESQDQLMREQDLPISYYRLAPSPFTQHLVEFFEKHDRVLRGGAEPRWQMAA
jgi:2-oxoglutarate ferredoxin oxidoreductase subunit alpha